MGFLLGTLWGIGVTVVAGFVLPSLLLASSVMLRVPKVCVDELYQYALAVPLNLDDAKAKVLALQRGETVQVGDCTVQVEP